MKVEKPLSVKKAQERARQFISYKLLENKKEAELDKIREEISLLYESRYKKMGISWDAGSAITAVLEHPDTVFYSVNNLFGLPSTTMKFSQSSYVNHLPRIFKNMKLDGFLVFNKKASGWVLHPEIKKNLTAIAGEEKSATH